MEYKNDYKPRRTTIGMTEGLPKEVSVYQRVGMGSQPLFVVPSLEDNVNNVLLESGADEVRVKDGEDTCTYRLDATLAYRLEEDLLRGDTTLLHKGTPIREFQYKKV